MKRKFLASILTLTMLAGLMPVTAFASENDSLELTASSNQSGSGWTWDAASKTLTLSGAAITDSVMLPADSTIVAEDGTVNSIVLAEGDAPITTSGTINISGSGKLTLTAAAVPDCYPICGAETINVTETELTTYGWGGLNARNVTITDANIDLRGFGNGIYYKDVTGSSTVTLENVSGSIVGEQDCGIELYIEYNSDNSTSDMDEIGVIINNCDNLTINGELTREKSNSDGHRSAIWVYTRDAETNAFTNITNSNVTLNGSGGGVFVNSHSDNSVSEDASAAWVSIDNSVVSISTITTYWAAIFVNNNGTGALATSKIDISDSSVQALSPNDVAIMTSTKDADSIVNITDSAVEMEAAYAGIRAKANTSDAGEATVADSTLLITGTRAGSHLIVDEMDNGNSSDGFSGISSDSKVVIPVDCEVTFNQDGTWDIPEGGTVLINDKEVTYESGATLSGGATIKDLKPTSFSWFFYMMMKRTFDITADAAEGGTITSDGVTSVQFLHDITYTITADEGYELTDVLVDGESVGAVSEYTFEKVGKAHTIAAVFTAVEAEEASEDAE